jgi:hypothetical protein
MKISPVKSGIHFKILKILVLCLFFTAAGSTAVPENRAVGAGADGRLSDAGARSPERIILNVTGNPSESLAVTWRTGAEVRHPRVQIVPVTDFPVLREKVTTIHAVREEVRLEKDQGVYYYSAVFQSLMADRTYAYRVGADDHWSEWNQFQTASKGHKPFAFLYFGDPQEHIKSMCSRIFRAAYKKAPDADFWLFVGDLVNNGDRDEEWAELFDAFGWIPRTTPMMLLPGNHEYPSRIFFQGKDYRLFHLWRPQFTLPENGPPGLEETAYSIDYQGARFVMLNGNEKLEEQAEWLDRILSDHPQAWTIAAIHQPVYSSARHRDNKRLRRLLAPVFDKHSVDLVLQGHDHNYCRTHKVRNGVRVGDHEEGTVYITSVSGPKFYPVKTEYEGFMAKMGTGRQLFQVIRIDHNRLFYQSLDARGEVYDSFTLEKPLK